MRKMADHAVESHPPPQAVTDFSSCLSIPPLDDAFFSDVPSNKNDNAMHEDLDFDFSFDDLWLPSFDLEELLSDSICATKRLESSDQENERVEPDSDFALFAPAPEPGSGDIFESDGSKLVHLPRDSDHGSNSSGVLNSESPGIDSKPMPEYINVPSPESNGSNRGISGCGGTEELNSHSPESQESGHCGSNVSEESKDCYRAVSSMQNCNRTSSGVEVCNQKIVKNSMLKRKKVCEVSANGDASSNLVLRISKSRKSVRNVENSYSDTNVDELKGDEEKKNARMIRNRESAQLSRQRKKQYVEELEDKVRAMHGTIQDLNAKISYFMAENVTLRQQIGAGSVNGAVLPPQMTPPHPGMLPHPAVMYPWMPSAPAFMMRPHGSQVPLVPIPRLKPQKPTQVSKTSKKVDNKKSEGPKTKKVAGVSFLGLLFFMVLFGCLAPMVNEKYGGVRDVFSVEKSYFGGRYYENHHGRVLMINGTDHGVKYGGEKECSSNSGVRHGQSGNLSGGELSDDEFVHKSNGSEPLMASLFVPRNDKLVKIDGNLIIHSVLASEKARIFHNKEGSENGLAVRGDLAPAIPAPGAGINGAGLPLQMALDAVSGSSDKNNMNSKVNDGMLQQWFLEGPMLSSGMCTEVFRFDASPASVSGAIIPASAARNISEEKNKTSARLSKGRNRRILQGHPVPLSESSYNVTHKHDVKNPRKKNLKEHNSTSSVVVSVLVDPREGNDVDADGVMGTKTLSSIFVVVLIDSVKYVTYSCILPFKSATSHL